jgi:hypothetical protein
MAEDNKRRDKETYYGYILIKREVYASTESQARTLMRKRAAGIRRDSILRDMEIDGIMVEEE